MAYLVFDLIVLIILAAFTIRGAARGLVLSLCSLLAVVVAFAGAGIAARTLSPMVAQALEPKFAAVIEEHLEEAIQHTEFTSPEGGVASTPAEVSLAGVLDILRDMGLYETLIDTVNDAVEKGMTHVAASAAAKVAAALAQSAAYHILFAVSFVLLTALWQVVSRVLDLVSRLPVLDTLNKSMGALFGLLQAWLIVCILAWLLRFGNVVDQETVEKTFLLRFFLDFNPLALLGSLS